MARLPSMVPGALARRQKVHLYLSAALIAGTLVAVLWLLSTWLFQEGFRRVEDDQVRRNLDQVRESVAEQVMDLESTVRHWSIADDTWTLMGGKDARFLTTSLTPSVLANLHLDSVAWCDPSGALIAGRLLNHATEEIRDLPARDLKQIEGICASAMASEGRVSGLRTLGGRRILFATHPVLPSSGIGPARGVTVVSRDLSTVLALARRSTFLDLDLPPVESPGVPPAARDLVGAGASDPEEILETRDDDTLVAWTLLPGVEGHPPALLRLTEPRPIHRQGLATLRAFRWSVLFLVGASALAIVALLSRLVLSRKSHREAERLYQTVVERTAEGILLVRGEHHRIVEANRAAERILGRGARELRGMPLLTLLEVHPERYAAAMGVLRAADSASLGDARARHGDGTILELEATASAVSPDDPDQLCVVLHDATERIRAEESVRHHAFHDPLTGLPNRLLFADRLSQAISKARRTGESLGVAYLDLDDFKAVNDSLGHDAGDLLLRQAADRLRELVRGDDTVSRQGGDEFLLLLSSPGGPESTLLVAERLVEKFRQPFEILGQEFVTTASVGIALFPGDGVVAEDLTRNADVAMYHAKERGQNRVELYDAAMRERVSASIHFRSRLQSALDREEFVLHYQPQVRLADGRVGAVEALVRWHDPERGLVFPSEFIRAAEDCGLILPLGEWVLRRACADARAWQGAGFADLRVAVNLSPAQIRRRGLDALIERVLSDTGCDPRNIQMEIAEGIALQRADEVRTVLESLRKLGLTVALNDFGTGRSTLGHLRSLPMDALKIDREFVAELTIREESQAIVQGIVGLAHALHLEVVAGGVETRRQLTALRACGCDRVQGFGVCRPVLFDDISQILRQPADLLHDLEDPSSPPPALA